MVLGSFHIGCEIYSVIHWDDQRRWFKDGGISEMNILLSD